MDLLDALDFAPDPVVLTRWRDKRLVRALLPEARVQSVESGLSRRRWIELPSTFFSASTVSFLMGVVHLWAGLLLQAALTVAAVGGLVVYHRRPRVEKRLLRLGMPERQRMGGLLPRRLGPSSRHRARRRLRRGPERVSRRRCLPISPRRRPAARALIRGGRGA